MEDEMMVIQIDSRESNNSKIKEYFTKNNIEYFVSKLPCGDYANPQNMKIIVELKHSHNDGLGELVTNLCRSVNHQRFVNEINLAKKIGVENFIVLIASKDITNVDEIHLWKNKYGKVNPETFENRNTKYQNLWDAAKAILSKNTYIKKKLISNEHYI